MPPDDATVHERRAAHLKALLTLHKLTPDDLDRLKAGTMTAAHRATLLRAARLPAAIAAGGLLFTVAFLFAPETRVPTLIKLGLAALCFLWFAVYPAWLGVPRIIDALTLGVASVEGRVEIKMRMAAHQTSSFISSIKVRVPESRWVKLLEPRHLGHMKEGRSYVLHHGRRSRILLFPEPADDWAP